MKSSSVRQSPAAGIRPCCPEFAPPLRAAESIFMTNIQVISPTIPGNRMPRFTAFQFGGVAYLTFLFHDSVRHRLRIGGSPYRRQSMLAGIRGYSRQSSSIIAVMALFAIQHSIMTRNSFKHWWTQFIPMSVERCTYVLCSSLMLMVLFWQWRQMPAVIWNIAECSATNTAVIGSAFQPFCQGRNGADHFSIVHKETVES
jgi:methanethiol S-methyltransferase